MSRSERMRDAASNAVTRAMARTLVELQKGIEPLSPPEAVTTKITDLHMHVEALEHLNGRGSRSRCDGKLIRYDLMDPATSPIELEVCPNCNLPARVRRGRKSDVYIHTKPKGGRKRHYCKLSHDGLKVEVVMPVTSEKTEDKEKT